MLDEKDLQAIAKLIRESEARTAEKINTAVSESEARMSEKISESEARMSERIDTAISQSEARMSERIDAAIGQSEARTAERISQSESRMMAMMESYFEPKFNLLEDQIKLIQEKLTPVEVQEETEARLDVLEAVVKRHSREIEKLKKAQ